MTKSSVPPNPKSSRAKGRKPQTIDLSAKVVSEDTISQPQIDSSEPAKADAPEHTQTINSQNEKPEPVTSANQKSTSTDQNKTADAKPASAKQPKNSAPGSKAAVLGLIFGLVGGVAGAVLYPILVPAEKPSAPDFSKFEALISQNDALEVRTKGLEAALTEAKAKLSETEQQRLALINGLNDLSQKVDNLPEQPIPAGDTGAPSAETEQKITTLEQRLSEEIKELRAQLEASNSKLAREQQAFTPLSGRVDTLEGRINDIAKQNIDPLPAIRYALSARLEQAVASGKPFGTTLEALRKAGITEADLADIAIFAPSGAPTAQQLKAEFAEPSQAMIGYERSQSGEGITDKLIRMSERVVRIRPRDNAVGNDISSLIVRIEAALDRGSFADAALLWNNLPDAARQLSALWGKRLNDRANAAKALSNLSNKAVTGLESSVQ